MDLCVIKPIPFISRNRTPPLSPCRTQAAHHPSWTLKAHTTNLPTSSSSNYYYYYHNNNNNNNNNTSTTPDNTSNDNNNNNSNNNNKKNEIDKGGVDEQLLSLLQKRRTEEAWELYSASPHLPNSVCLSRLVCQLSYQSTPLSLSRARSILSRLRQLGQLHRLDNNSLGLLAVSASKFGSLPFATSLIRSMLRSGYVPHLKAWSAVVSRLSSSPDDGPSNSLHLFHSILRLIRSSPDPSLLSNSLPDTAAFNAALNASANIGDLHSFAQLLDQMPHFNLKRDVLTYNVMIKLCARLDRKELLVFVLERIIDDGLVPCITTLTSLVAAYVGFGDLDMAEKVVQAMREGRLDLCGVLRDSNSLELDRIEPVFQRLLPKAATAAVSGGPPDDSPPLLPKAYYPDSRIYTTLMKGYLKEGRVADVVRMLEAMRQQSDAGSHPDHVTYTTVISALVKAGSMDRARQVLAEMESVGVPANLITYNILLKGYCQQLQVHKARELIHDMEEEVGIQPDVVSYNIIIDGYVLIDDSAGALAYFNEMRSRGIAPTKISYTTLVKAFALAGQPKLAQKVFDEMLKDPRVKVDLIAWNMLIEGYSRLGLVDEAKKVVEEMKAKGFHPDIATYGSLANGISVARKPGEALILWNEIKERCQGRAPDGKQAPVVRPDEGLLDTLAEVCVRAAFFRKALEIVACMEENGISPNKTKYKKIYIEMHSRMFTSKHASQARQDRRRERKRAAEAFKFWLGLPNSYYGSEWRLEPLDGDGVEYPSA